MATLDQSNTFISSVGEIVQRLAIQKKQKNEPFILPSIFIAQLAYATGFGTTKEFMNIDSTFEIYVTSVYGLLCLTESNTNMTMISVTTDTTQVTVSNIDKFSYENIIRAIISRFKLESYDEPLQNPVKEEQTEIPKIDNLKPVDEIAKEVITGKWGQDPEKKEKLTAAGYDYTEVQKRVNALLGRRY
jgi:hypothetical protein